MKNEVVTLYLKQITLLGDEGERGMSILPPPHQTYLDNRNSSKQKLGSKKVTKSVDCSTGKSRVAAGFSDFVA